MFQRIIDDMKTSTGEAMRQTSLAAVAVLLLLVATAFSSAALFVAALDQYGPIEACLAVGGLYLVASAIAASFYFARKRQIERRAAERARSTAQAFLIDPVMVATGIQIVRAIGVKRLYPERTVVAVSGDGDFLMNGQDFATAIQFEAPVIVIVADNGLYGTIRMHQEREYPGRVSATVLRNPDFAALARA